MINAAKLICDKVAKLNVRSLCDCDQRHRAHLWQTVTVNSTHRCPCLTSRAPYSECYAFVTIFVPESVFTFAAPYLSRHYATFSQSPWLWKWKLYRSPPVMGCLRRRKCFARKWDPNFGSISKKPATPDTLVFSMFRCYLMSTRTYQFSDHYQCGPLHFGPSGLHFTLSKLHGFLSVHMHILYLHSNTEYGFLTVHVHMRRLHTVRQTSRPSLHDCPMPLWLIFIKTLQPFCCHKRVRNVLKLTNVLVAATAHVPISSA